jgi:hypothetical protein
VDFISCGAFLKTTSNQHPTNNQTRNKHTKKHTHKHTHTRTTMISCVTTKEQQKGDGPHVQQMAAGPSPQGAHELVGVLAPTMWHGDQTTH